jgi:myo-inositol-1(or 4)-monophosphatase
MGNKQNDFLETAVLAAQRAGDITLQSLGKLSKEDVDMKKASDFVTRVDRDSERSIIHTIREVFPDHRFLAEESVKETGSGTPGWHKLSETYLWIIDPLDGTTNYIHGYPVFSVSIALQYKGELIIGVILDPMRDELFTAEAGKGSFLNSVPIRVSPVIDIAYSLIATGFPFRKKESIEKYLELFKNIFHRVSDIRRAGSAALDLAHLASGRCDGFFELGLSPWDMAAGSIIIREAGGIVSDFGGGENYLSTGNIIAGTPYIHDEILKEAKGVFQGFIES